MPVNRWAARAVAVAGATLLGACTTLGPDFKRPEVTWLDTWTGGSLEPLSTTTGARSSEKTIEWWRRFAPTANAAHQKELQDILTMLEG